MGETKKTAKEESKKKSDTKFTNSSVGFEHDLEKLKTEVQRLEEHRNDLKNRYLYTIVFACYSFS